MPSFEDAETETDDVIDVETGKVKWYDPVKKYGFVSSDETGEDVHLPKSVLMAYGLETIAPGTTMTFVAEDVDKRGPDDTRAPNIVRIDAIDASTATGPAIEPIETIVSEARVTSWKPGGFGFAGTERDEVVFIHSNVLANRRSLTVGEKVVLTYRRSGKGVGFEAMSVWTRA